MAKDKREEIDLETELLDSLGTSPEELISFAKSYVTCAMCLQFPVTFIKSS